MGQFAQTIKFKYALYERRISSVTLITGFIFDNLTLRRIDQLFDVLALSFYVVLSGLCILGLGILDRKRERGEIHEDWHFWLLITLQFAFGGLFSAFFIFYTRSGAFASSWPFFLALAGLLIGNEIFKARYSILIFRVAIYFFVLFSFAALYIPVLLSKMGDNIFILSGLVSLLLIWIFLHLLGRILPETIYRIRRQLMTGIIGIYAVINLLYFTNIIPPIPLALKEVGVYHTLTKTGNAYIVSEEERPWYSFLQRRTYHTTLGETAYVVSAVFAPTDLETTIVHEWQYFDESRGDWRTVSQVKFDIIGGRVKGYRGYSLKSNITPGKWRVNIETERGQLVGRIKFRVERVSTPPSLETKTFL